ncbi:MAG: DUF1015 family protein [Myxococcota bacterium]
MSDVRPFRALRFVGDPTSRIAGPYDVISPEEREALAREPESIVHLTLPPGPEGERDYTGAAATLERWKRAGVLARDPAHAIYVLKERVPDGRVRRGFLALVRLASYDERVVLPHERTMAGPKRDRLRLTRAVRANLEPLFFLYEDRDAKLDAQLDGALSRTSLTRCTSPARVELTLGALQDSAQIATLRAFLADRPLIIADGHHRYETMLRYRDECRERLASPGPDDPHEFVLAYLVNAFDPGSHIQAIHRVLNEIESDPRAVFEATGFSLEPLPPDGPAEPLLAKLAERSDSDAFVLADSAGDRLLASRARGKRTAVEVLHEEILPALGGPLRFDARPDRVLARARRGEIRLGILLQPLDPDTLFRVVQEGAVLPQKSTFFSPKIPSGLLLREMA